MVWEAGTSAGGMDGAGQVRVRAVVRDVVAAVAPAEVVVVDGLALLDDATVVRRLSGRAGRREPLGFGLGELAALVTPAVWLVLDQTARKFAESAVDGSLRGARGLLRKALRRTDEPLTIPPLTAGQLAEVRTHVLEGALHRGLSVECAETVADAVVARLALTSAGAAADVREDPADDSPSGGEGHGG